MINLKQNHKKTAIKFYVSGIILCFAALVVADFDVTKLSSSGSFEKHVYDGTISDHATLRIDTSYEDIHVLVSDDEQLHITYYENDRMSYTFDEEEDSFTMKKEDRRKFYNYMMTMNFSEGSEDRISIEVPKTFSGSIEIDTGNGDIQLSNLNELDFVSINTTYGAVTLNNLKINTALEVASTNGDMKLEQLAVQEDIHVKTTYGRIDVKDVLGNQSMMMDFSNVDVTLDQVNIKDSLTVDTSYGDIEIVRSNAGSTRLDTSNGAIKFHDAFTTSTLDATTSYGAITFKDLKADQISLIASNDDIEGTVIGKKSEYTVDSDVSGGNTTLLPSKGSTRKSLYAKTSYGDCNIEFMQE